MEENTAPNVDSTSNRQGGRLEELWQFKGHGFSSAEFNAAMLHFYRAEVSRANTWRTRLDITTNWAVVTTAAALTFTFSQPGNSEVVLIVETMLVLLFLFIEARRYRYYELWASRVRILENNYFAAILSPPFVPHSEWADRLTESLRNPRFPISLSEAFGRRYRRNYAPIFFLLALSYLLKITIYPITAFDFSDILERAAVGPIPGWFVLTLGFVVNGIIVAAGIATARLREAPGEILTEPGPGTFATVGRYLRRAAFEVVETDIHLPTLPWFERRKMLGYIITDEQEAVSQALIQELGRGVTLLRGEGMYTRKEHAVLMVVFNIRQSDRLKRLVYERDPKAFVIITEATDVRGLGFRPLET